MKRVVQFFKDSYAELKKVVWPSRDEVASSTKVVIISVVLVALALGIVDFVLISAVDLIF
ncbi:MAG: preprotein translocase subunit SecE [Spirochaetaceae bacterium]|nr:MAG: preprotein translocase subunit SecE [Spirochaetaceae bacterium]